ncbi:unnamed protein product [Urochloa humidicola]
MAAATTSIAVSVTMGVLKPILGKLTTLLVDKCKKLKGVRKPLSFLQDELSTMYAFLEKLEPMDDLDPLANNWRSRVREMAYDIEDVIDDFTCQLGSDEDGPKEGFLKKISCHLKALRARHPIASQISELKARVLEANERRRRYQLDDFIPTSTSTSVDPRISALYNEASSLVGIENPKEELISMLMDERREKLRVVSIVGLGGLGKTTLARKVYHEVGEQFNCKAFVSVSQTPDISRLLHGLLSQLGLHPPSCAHELTDLIDYLREYLHTKRYLIVVDDLWDVPAWNIIKCVFPENGKPSRVIVTTRQRDVAVSCSSDDQGVHSMRPLNDQDSRKLFNNRIFGPDSEDACPPQFTDVSCEILKKCRGLPLAIITVASILACQRTRLKEEWEHIKDCLAAQEPTNTTLNDMMHILDLSYKFLPRRLQACFLYLGAYPEDFDIEKDDLLGKWVAEGFVSGSISRDAWHVAEDYLKELVNRSMIQHVPRRYDEAPYYKVHDMMLEMILKKCRENNFARLAHDQQEAMADLQVKVRRLAVHMSDAKDDTEVDVIIDALSSWVSPPFPFLEHLKVPGWTFSTAPRWIGGLHNLQSLKFGVKEVSNFRIFGMLPNLIKLDLRIEGDVPAEGIVISGFKLLERFHLGTRSPSEVAFEAGAMPNLRQLELMFDQKESDKATVLVGLEHLGRLREIYILGARVGAINDTTYRFRAFINMFREAVKGLPSQPKVHSFDNVPQFRYQE